MYFPASTYAKASSFVNTMEDKPVDRELNPADWHPPGPSVPAVPGKPAAFRTADSVRPDAAYHAASDSGHGFAYLVELKQPIQAPLGA